MFTKDYILIVQCHIVKERCSGYFCEQSFNERTGGFSAFDPEKKYRTLYLTCGGCCGRALQRKVSNLLKNLQKKEDISRDRVVIQLSSCITKESYHGEKCPHLDYLKNLLNKLNVDIREDTHISKTATRLRKSGKYANN